MSRLTGADAKGLMEAYNNVYAPQELTEEQVWEEVEEWVNSLLEEGYDLSDYTWEEMYENYVTENWAAVGKALLGYGARGLNVAKVGAKPVFCDIQESDLHIDIKKAEKLITCRTKAIMPVHIYGMACNMDEVIEFAKKHKLTDKMTH